MPTTLENVRRRCEPLLRRVLHFYWRFSRGATLGVRAVVFDEARRVFLVRHSYVAGWHLPGGGVEVGETCLTALRRELREEGNIELDGATPDLLGIFFNRAASPRDHVLVYVVRDYRQSALPKPNREIIECGFYDVAALPEGTTAATRRRISEASGLAKSAPEWS
ncbi:MAG TPA: NUDIX domain-containing protein [Xanthobacteraceae bacterium]|nr:NUDIX domain-containing protein [Xanthobacteraceae bacterium]